MGVVMDTEEGVAKDAEEGVAAVTTETSGYIPAVSSEDTSHPDVVVSQAQVVAPPPAVVASDPTVVAPATKWLAAVRTVVAPVRNAVKGVGLQSGRFRLWSRSFPVPRHRLRMSSPRFGTWSPPLPVWAARSHERRLILPPCSASPQWPQWRLAGSEEASTVPACRQL